MIEIKNLSKSFGDVRVLQDINLKIESGEVVSIIGPSGSGKSTLIRTINSLEAHDSGKLIIDSTEVTKKTVSSTRKKVGMVFQSFNLFANMNVVENITYAPIRVLKMAKKKALAEASELLKRVGLKGYKYKKISDLSGGQMQRVAIARALAMNPEIMLFDEPTSALDREVIKEVLDVIESFSHKGMTIVIVTHELEFAKRISDKIVFLDKGKIVEVNDPKSFFSQPKTTRAKEFLSKTL